MIIRLHRNFRKQLKKLRSAEVNRFKERRELFIRNPSHPLLENHPLRGKFEGYRSFNVGGDLRVIFIHEDVHLVSFVAIGTHHDLYGS